MCPEVSMDAAVVPVSEGRSLLATSAGPGWKIAHPGGRLHAGCALVELQALHLLELGPQRRQAHLVLPDVPFDCSPSGEGTGGCLVEADKFGMKHDFRDREAQMSNVRPEELTGAARWHAGLPENQLS